MEKIRQICYRIISRISPEIGENVKGDLEELYQRKLEESTAFQAILFFLWEWITCLKLILNSQPDPSISLWYANMKMSWRMLSKHRSYTVISLSGLTIGLVAFFMIYLFVRTELSYDQYHDKADRIYRLNYDLTDRNEKLPWAIINGGWAERISEQFPEVEAYTRITTTWGSRSLIRSAYNRKGHYEEGFMWADGSLTSVFDFEILSGDTQNPIGSPHTAMISESIANKYFRSIDDAIGQTLNRNDETNYTITAVYRDMPTASHFHAHMIASFLTGTTPEQRAEFWTYSYLVISDKANPVSLQQKLSTIVEQHAQDTPLPRLLLQPLTSIYLESNLMYEFEPVGNHLTVQLFMGVGCFILLIAGINFVNLSTAYGVKRMKEIGLKKVLGAERRSLIQQILTESTLLALMAVFFAGILTYLILPYVEVIVGKVLYISNLWSFNSIGFLLIFVLMMGVLSGTYPAFYLSAFRPQDIFAKTRSREKQILRKGLSVFQFAMSISLVAGSMVVYQQLSYFQSKDLGIQPEQALVIPLDYDDQFSSHYEFFRNKALNNPHVKNMSLMSSLPGEMIRMWVGNVRPSQGAEEDKVRVKVFNTDFDFINTLGIKMAKGRDYSRSFATDTTKAVIINETAAAALGITSLDTATIFDYSPSLMSNFKVIGVVEDFHFASLHSAIEPLVIRNRHGYSNKGKLVIRLDTEDLTETMAYLEEVWNSIHPDRTMESYFLSDYFQTKYIKEQTTMKLLISFTILALGIACLGLFGLATYVMQNRQKEIGVRKVLGATFTQLWSLLTLEFVWLILLSFLIAAPFTYYLLDYWLSNFAYRTDIHLTVFILAIFAVLLPAITSISIKSLQVARTNPSDVLGAE
ncbi:MAG: FtsX-like permease family protein [Cytophagales bacterium]|nr:FtsX-like permease family protein [Cytophagales bacterium]